jgi:hypothetical protein
MLFPYKKTVVYCNLSIDPYGHFWRRTVSFIPLSFKTTAGAAQLPYMVWFGIQSEVGCGYRVVG